MVRKLLTEMIEEQMDMLGLKETIDWLATANGVRWYGHVLRKDDNSVLRVALDQCFPNFVLKQTGVLQKIYVLTNLYAVNLFGLCCIALGFDFSS